MRPLEELEGDDIGDVGLLASREEEDYEATVLLQGGDLLEQVRGTLRNSQPAPVPVDEDALPELEDPPAYIPARPSAAPSARAWQGSQDVEALTDEFEEFLEEEFQPQLRDEPVLESLEADLEEPAPWDESDLEPAQDGDPWDEEPAQPAAYPGSAPYAEDWQQREQTPPWEKSSEEFWQQEGMADWQGEANTDWHDAETTAWQKPEIADWGQSRAADWQKDTTANWKREEAAGWQEEGLADWQQKEQPTDWQQQEEPADWQQRASTGDWQDQEEDDGSGSESKTTIWTPPNLSAWKAQAPQEEPAEEPGAQPLRDEDDYEEKTLIGGEDLFLALKSPVAASAEPVYAEDQSEEVEVIEEFEAAGAAGLDDDVLPELDDDLLPELEDELLDQSSPYEELRPYDSDGYEESMPFEEQLEARLERDSDEESIPFEEQLEAQLEREPDEEPIPFEEQLEARLEEADDIVDDLEEAESTWHTDFDPKLRESLRNPLPAMPFEDRLAARLEEVEDSHLEELEEELVVPPLGSSEGVDPSLSAVGLHCENCGTNVESLLVRKLLELTEAVQGLQAEVRELSRRLEN